MMNTMVEFLKSLSQFTQVMLFCLFLVAVFSAMAFVRNYFYGDFVKRQNKPRLIYNKWSDWNSYYSGGRIVKPKDSSNHDNHNCDSGKGIGDE